MPCWQDLFACSAWQAPLDIDGPSSTSSACLQASPSAGCLPLPAGMPQRRVGSLRRLAEHCQCWSQDTQQLASATRACRAQTGSLLLKLLVQRAPSSSTLRFMTRALGSA